MKVATKYDSRLDTLQHIAQVRSELNSVVRQIERRAADHDASKMVDPEKSVFDRVTPKLRELTYGSPEYQASLSEMKDALKHHYAHNRHHPEHHQNGISDMNLIDLVEMLCDWKAASSRHADGDIFESLKLNRKRFSIGDEVFHLLENTAETLWGHEKP